MTLDDLRRTFAGRVGAPSAVEGEAQVRPSAVLAAFWEHEGEVEVLLTRRSQGLRAHRGEVSFPGGRVDPGETTVAAALREAHEEVALDPAGVEVLGELDHLMTVTSRSFIVPFVAVLPGRPADLVPNPAEVDTVIFVPVAELLADADVYREERWTWSPPPDGERSIFFFELVGDTVWGATAAMLRQLLGLALGLGTGIDHR
ncbi:MAG: CoA pyrophosphatase [Acidimicrobiia bacterium]|nr:CoA pyrophosphatase [Acidimicrobiia bacterium]